MARWVAFVPAPSAKCHSACQNAGINGAIHAICDVKFTPKANGTKVIYAAIDAAGRAAPAPSEPRRVPVGIIKVVAQALLAQDSKHRDKMRLMHK